MIVPLDPTLNIPTQDVAFKSLNIALSIDESQNSLEAKAKAIPHYKTGNWTDRDDLQTIVSVQEFSPWWLGSPSRCPGTTPTLALPGLTS